MSMTNTLEVHHLNWLRGIAMPAPPGALYVALYAGKPSDDGAGMEVTTTIRPAGRVQVTFGVPVQGAGDAPSTMSNTSIIDFGVAAGAVPEVTHLVLFDSQVAGTPLRIGAVSSPKPIATGDPVSFPVSALTVSQN